MHGFKWPIHSARRYIPNGHAQGLRRVEWRYTVRRWSICACVVLLLVLSVFIPALIIVGQVRAPSSSRMAFSYV